MSSRLFISLDSKWCIALTPNYVAPYYVTLNPVSLLLKQTESLTGAIFPYFYFNFGFDSMVRVIYLPPVVSFCWKIWYHTRDGSHACQVIVRLFDYWPTRMMVEQQMAINHSEMVCDFHCSARKWPLCSFGRVNSTFTKPKWLRWLGW